MKTIKQKIRIIHKIYREMYKQAIPESDFEEMIETRETRMPNFFMAYYLPMEDQTEIMSKILKRYKLENFEIKQIHQSVMLGASPNSCFKTWKKHWKMRDEGWQP